MMPFVGGSPYLQILDTDGVTVLKTLYLPSPDKGYGQLEWVKKKSIKELIDGSERERRQGFLPRLTLKWKAYDDVNLRGRFLGDLDRNQARLQDLMAALAVSPGQLRVCPGPAPKAAITVTGQVFVTADGTSNAWYLKQNVGKYYLDSGGVWQPAGTSGLEQIEALVGTPTIYRSDWQGLTRLYSTLRTNYLLYSGAQNNGAYTLTGASIGGPVSGPDGTNTGFTLTATGTNGQTVQTATVPSGTFTSSVWIRRRTGTGQIYILDPGGTWQAVAVTASWQRFNVSAASNGTTGNWGVRCAVASDAVDIACGGLEPGSSATGFLFTQNSTVSITDYTLNSAGLVTFANSGSLVGNASFGPGDGSTSQFTLKVNGNALPAGSNPTVNAIYRKTGWDGDNLAYSWGRTNLFFDSDDISTANWVRSGLTNSAGKACETTANGAHYTYQNFTSTYGYVAITGEFKASERNLIYLWAQSISNAVVYFDLNAGTALTVSGTVLSYSIVAMGDGYYRCKMIALRATSGSMGFGVTTTDGVSSYQGTTGYGVYYRHLQYETGIDFTGYMASGASNGTGDPIVNPSKAKLSTSSRTQMFLHSIFDGSGATPNGWTNGAMTTARSLVASGFGTEDGAQDIFFDNSSAQATNYFFQGVTLAANTTFCISTLIKTANVTAGSARARSFLAIQSGPSGFTNYYPPCSANPSGGPTGIVQVGVLLLIVTTAATSGNANLRIAFGGSDALQGTCQQSRPQCEVGTSRTAFIPSTAATVTVTDYSVSDVTVTFGAIPTTGAALTWDGYVAGIPPLAGTVFSWDGAFKFKDRGFTANVTKDPKLIPAAHVAQNLELEFTGRDILSSMVLPVIP